MREDAPNERFAVRLGDHPVEEVALCSAENAGRLERGPRQDALRIIVPQPEHSQRDGLGDNHQKGMLKEQRVGLDFAAVDQLQELRPQLSFQGNGRIVL